MTIHTDTTPESNKTNHDNDINWTEGLQRLSGDKALYVDILKIFLSEHETDGMKLVKLYEENETQSFNKLIHIIKGVSSNLSINNLYKITRDIDRARKKNPNSPVDTDAFIKVFNSSIVAIRQAIKINS